MEALHYTFKIFEGCILKPFDDGLDGVGHGVCTLSQWRQFLRL